MVKEELARQFPLFSSFSEKKLKEISEYLNREVFPEGEILFEEGDPGDWIFFIVKGKVGLFRSGPFGNEVKVAAIDEGTPLGELSFFTDHYHSSKAVALKEIHALVLDKNGYEKLKQEDPLLAVKLLEIIAKVIAENKKFVDTVCFIWGGPKG